MSNNWSPSDGPDRLNGRPKEGLATNSSMLDQERELEREQGGGVAARQMFTAGTSTSAYPSSNPNQRGATTGIDPRASGGAAPPYAFAGSGRGGAAGGLPPPSVGGDDPNMQMQCKSIDALLRAALCCRSCAPWLILTDPLHD